MRVMIAVAVLAGCGEHGSSPTPCTPEGQAVAGTALQITQVQLLSSGIPGNCASQVLASTADVTAAFPNNDAPTEVMNADFTRDRVVLGTSNPVIEFAVDDGTGIVVGEEQLCQGIAPSCVAYIVHGTTRTTLSTITCPYTGPDPCLAP